MLRTSLVVQWLRFIAFNTGGPGLILGQEDRSHMPQVKLSHAATKVPQLKILHAATKTQCSQINKYIKKQTAPPQYGHFYVTF